MGLSSTFGIGGIRLCGGMGRSRAYRIGACEECMDWTRLKGECGGKRR